MPPLPLPPTAEPSSPLKGLPAQRLRAVVTRPAERQPPLASPRPLSQLQPPAGSEIQRRELTPGTGGLFRRLLALLSRRCLLSGLSRSPLLSHTVGKAP